MRFNEKTTVLKFLSNWLRGSDRSHDTKCTIYKFNPKVSVSIDNAIS